MFNKPSVQLSRGNLTLFCLQVYTWESKNGQFWGVELYTFATCVKIVSKNIVWDYRPQTAYK